MGNSTVEGKQISDIERDTAQTRQVAEDQALYSVAYAEPSTEEPYEVLAEEGHDTSQQLKSIATQLDQLENINQRLDGIERMLRGGVLRPVPAPDRDRLLEQAWRDQQLLSLLIDDDYGLGLELLMQLRSSEPLSATQVAEQSLMSINVAVPILAQLVQFGAVEVRNEAFVCTPHGDQFLRTIGKAAELGQKLSISEG